MWTYLLINVYTFVYINAYYEKLIIPNTKLRELFYPKNKNHRTNLRYRPGPSLKCCTLFLVETLPWFSPPRELHSLFLQQTARSQKTLKHSSVEQCASNTGSWESTDACDWKSLGAGGFLTATALQAMSTEAMVPFTTYFPAAPEICKAGCWQVWREPQPRVGKEN